MSINFNTIAPISATVLSIGGLVFQIGKHSEKLDLLNNKVYAQEKKVDENYKYINDMKIFMSRSDEKLDDINISMFLLMVSIKTLLSQHKSYLLYQLL